MKRKLFLVIFFAAAGILDASYLAYEHFSPTTSVICPPTVWADCGRVLSSPYATPFGVPLALIGIIYYSSIFSIALDYLRSKKRILLNYLVFITIGGFLASTYFVFLQLFVIKAICLYCMLSALTSTLLFLAVQIFFPKARKQTFGYLTNLIYKNMIKPLLFATTKPDIIHEKMTNMGQLLGNTEPIKGVFKYLYSYTDESISQNIAGINFEIPVGLAAGFDYEAKLTQILPSVGFGFQAVGTVTNKPYEGNTPPRLGRLPKSRSLLVNKGFKSSGHKNIIKKLKKYSFAYPVAISIGRTNTLDLKTQKQSIEDILTTFKAFEKSKIDHTHYELNISCPNLKGNISFYPPKNLNQLLTAIDKLKLSKPVFIKMPINETNQEQIAMLNVIVKHNIAGVIYGNLQKDRTDPSFDKNEIKKAGKGNFSGKPTWERSNELISLAYKKYGKKLIVVGCGGVFNTEDAIIKIKKGASLIQLITGMVYEGPQIASQISIGISQYLEDNNIDHISDIRGS